jgi:hypothetical protein
MTPAEVVAHCNAVARHRRIDLYQRSHLTAMFTGLAFVGKLESLDEYLRQEDDG